MITRQHITGLVLAGGLGRRMSKDGRGLNKALQTFQGRPMVAHVIERLQPQVDRIILNVNQDTERFESFGWPLISDHIDGFAGPLAGLHAGLSACQTDWLLTCPCDSPFLPTDLVTRLAQSAAHDDAQLAVVQSEGRSQPVFALVRRDLATNLADFLSDGGRKIDTWYAPLRTSLVPFDNPDAFRNINTPEDLARYEQPDQSNKP